jgi:folate-binding protein YgfZ
MKFSGETRIFFYHPACVLRAEGPDSSSFLQGQFSNDLGKLQPGESRYGLWLDRRGRVLADSQVIRDKVSGFWIISLASGPGTIAGHLNAHLIADEVEITDRTGDFRGVSVLGGEDSALPPDPLAPTGLAFPGRRSRGGSWEVLYPEADAAGVEQALRGLPVLQEDEVERIRIRSGVPRVPADIGPGDLPNEGGLESEAVSYSKGCYLGQEIMARLRTKGRVRRRLVRVSGTGSVPPLPAGLFRGEKRVGELRSAVGAGAGFEGLALVAADVADPGAGLSLGPGDAASVDLEPLR